jgi:4-carboxymuconolactone decarboxylase
LTNDDERPFRRVAPKLAQLSAEVLFEDVWERPGLSKRDRCLITVAALVASYRPQQMPYYLNRALACGVTVEELGELLTHVAFYSGFPGAITAANALAALRPYDSEPAE